MAQYPHNGTLRDAQWIKQVPSRYSLGQVAQYLNVVGYQPAFNEESLASRAFPIGLESLERLMRLHQLTFPFENTPMHYAGEHTMDVTPEGNFHRLVHERKGGSYCFGLNGLLLEILRGLGFRAYIASGRVNNAHSSGGPVDYTPPAHCVILVQPISDTNETYMVDVGFGPSGITHPIKLSSHEDNVIEGLSATERHKLTKHPRSDSSLSYNQDLSSVVSNQWNVEIWHQKNDPSQEKWRLLYSFSEEEYWLQDILFASFGVSMRPPSVNASASLFWKNVLCIKVFSIDEGYEHIERSQRPMYRLSLVGKEVRKQLGSELKVIRTFENELDRIQALQELFGIQVAKSDHVHIEGRAAALDASK